MDVIGDVQQYHRRSQMQASVIVCTYNRSWLLARTLLALADQTVGLERFEVVVVNDGSTDDTETLCMRIGERLPNLRYVDNKRNAGICQAMEKGIRAAKGACLLFTDDDCIPNCDWVERMCAALERETIVAGMIVSPVSNFFKLCHNIAEFHPFLPGHKPGPAAFIAGANMGVQRAVIEDLGGFSKSNQLAPDMEMILRARARGYRITRATDSFVLHDPNRTSPQAIFLYAARHAEETIVLRNRYSRVLHTPFVLRLAVLILLSAPAIALWTTLGIYIRNPITAKYWKTIPVVGALKLAWCWGAARGLIRLEHTTAVTVREKSCGGPL